MSFAWFLQLIPLISSLTYVTTLVPLIVVLALTAIKDAIDDIVSNLVLVKTLNSRTKKAFIYIFRVKICLPLPPSHFKELLRLRTGLGVAQ